MVFFKISETIIAFENKLTQTVSTNKELSEDVLEIYTKYFNIAHTCKCERKNTGFIKKPFIVFVVLYWNDHDMEIQRSTLQRPPSISDMILWGIKSGILMQKIFIPI